MLGVRFSDPVRVLISGAPVTVRAATSLRAAAAIMSDEDVGLLIVEGDDGTIGVLSERDIVRAMSDGADPDADEVVAFATTDLASIEPETSIGQAAVAMQEANIRHLVVIHDGDLIGVVSIRDLVAASVEEIRSRG